jgi:hypothetical protein
MAEKTTWTPSLFGHIPKSFFLGPVIFCTSLAAETAYIVERLIAIPAGTFRLECRHTLCLFGHYLPDSFNAVSEMVCIIHNFATRIKYQTDDRVPIASTKV